MEKFTDLLRYIKNTVWPSIEEAKKDMQGYLASIANTLFVAKQSETSASDSAAKAKESEIAAAKYALEASTFSDGMADTTRYGTTILATNSIVEANSTAAIPAGTVATAEQLRNTNKSLEYIASFDGQVPDASETIKGKAAAATDAEAIAGINDNKFMTPKKTNTVVQNMATDITAEMAQMMEQHTDNHLESAVQSIKVGDTLYTPDTGGGISLPAFSTGSSIKKATTEETNTGADVDAYVSPDAMKAALDQFGIFGRSRVYPASGVVNINDMRTAGNYYVGLSSNRPSGLGSNKPSVVQVIGTETDGVQIYTELESGRTFIRAYYNSELGDWLRYDASQSAPRPNEDLLRLGEFRSITSAGTRFDLPNFIGTTWLYILFMWKPNGTLADIKVKTGLIAGGESVNTDNGTCSIHGFIWRMI